MTYRTLTRLQSLMVGIKTKNQSSKQTNTQNMTEMQVQAACLREYAINEKIFFWLPITIENYSLILKFKFDLLFIYDIWT